MMLRLFPNVFPHRLDVNWTHAEFSVARLPGEIRIPRIDRLDPGGRGSFDLLDNFRWRVVLRLREQDVDMVAPGIDFDEWRIVVLEHTGDIGVEFATLLVAQQLATTLGAEHEMDDDIGERLGHEGMVKCHTRISSTPRMRRNQGCKPTM